MCMYAYAQICSETVTAAFSVASLRHVDDLLQT